MADPVDLARWVERTSTKLREAGVRHALIGGLALAVHGYARATVDIDLVIDPDQLAITRTALAELGLLQTQRPVMVFRRARILRVVAAEDQEPLVFDVLMTEPQLWTSAIARAESVELATTSVPVASPEDLVLLKLLRNDERDRLDIRELVAVRALDRVYLSAQARALGLEAELAAVLPE